MPETVINRNVPSFQPYADGFAVGENTLAYITRMRESVEAGHVPRRELLVGDVLRRTCTLGGAVCAAGGCQAPEGFRNDDKRCSDLNLKDVTERLGMRPDQVLMVGVTADGIGFYDQLDAYSDKLRLNSIGIRELPGYNAFFARSSEDVVLGARLADCGFAAIEFKDRNGEDVTGFVHLTRTNLQGESALGFEVDGSPAGCFEYFMHEALAYYGGEQDSVRVRVAAAIKAEHFQYTFGDKGPEDLFPGWFDQGLLINKTDAEWQKGDPIDPTHIWEPQYREMLRYHIMRSGIQPEQLNEERMIDPADLELGHASNHAGVHGAMPAGRDAYFVLPRSSLR